MLELHFVVHKHAATHLHYDFRLEVQGVLKSWAIPKGPSMNPNDKRLAMMVEDHPYSYRHFEGVIPKGYGAGAVMIWDQGMYSVENLSKKEAEKVMLEGLKKGSLHFTLSGSKLKGDFALVHTSFGKENSWLLIKKKDRFATTRDVTKKNRSVVSHKTIEEIAKDAY